MTFLKDELLTLRAVEPSDADAMWEIENDSTQWVQNGMAAPFSHENLRNYASGYLADPYQEGQVRLVMESCGSIAGLVDIYQLSARNHTGFIGIYTRPEVRRKGFALRALGLVEKYAVSLLNLRVLAAKVMDNNTASQSLFEKAGYSRSGALHNWIQSGTLLHDMYLYEKMLT